VFALEPAVESSLRRFLQLLLSEERIAVPLACRESFPFANVSELLVTFADASGLSRAGDLADGEPGFGAWTVRGSTLFILHGLFDSREAELLSISVLEFIISVWAERVFLSRFPEVTHVLEFTDNSGAEWSARREAPSAMLMQRVSAFRSEMLSSTRTFVRTCRIPSACNVWADDLSRQRVQKVYAEATALGLTVTELTISPDLRDLAWLTAGLA